jgi:hypothetical protein
MSYHTLDPKTLTDTNCLNQLVKDIEGRRWRLELQWKLNLAFYRGRQYTFLNKATRRLQELPMDEGELPRYRVRLVNNIIISAVQSLLSKLTKNKPVLYATPSSGSPSDYQAAQVAEALLEYWWDAFNLHEKLKEALLWAIITGQGYWKISWDPYANAPFEVVYDPNGGIITDELLKSLYIQELEKEGADIPKETLFLGDIRVDVLSPFDVFPDPDAKTFEDGKFVICRHHLHPDEVKARWNIEIEADEYAGLFDDIISLQTTDKKKDRVGIFAGYFLPCGSLPSGAYIIWHKDHILEKSSWPYNFHQLPITKFSGLRVPGSVYDSSFVEHAIPLQKEYNKTISQIVQYKNLTVNPRIWAPYGALNRVRLTNEPGSVIEYKPVTDKVPQVEQVPPIPPYVYEHLGVINTALRDVFGLVEVTEGRVPPNVEAAIAIDLLQEMATDKLAPTIKSIENSIERAGQIMLAMAQQYYIEPRIVKIKGPGGASLVKKFSQADLNAELTVNVEAGSGFPRIRAGRQAQILNLMQLGLIDPKQAYKYLDIADLKGLANQIGSDESQALREHEKMLNGEVINEAAFRNVLAQVQQGINPLTGQEIQSQEEADFVLKQAAYSPLPYEDHVTHLRTHELFMKSPEFEGLPAEIKDLFLLHHMQTRDAFMQLMVQTKPPEPPRVALNLRGTVGPSAASEILNKAGVEVTPDEMQESPLATFVSDKLETPNIDEAGNVPASSPDALSLWSMSRRLAGGFDKQGSVLTDQFGGNLAEEEKVKREQIKTQIEQAKLDLIRKRLKGE